MSNTVVQYVLLRSDLLKELGWSIGALVAQACHASTAVLHLHKDDEVTIQYLNDLDNMHKVVLEEDSHVYMPRGKDRSMIDFAIVDGRMKSDVVDTKVYRGNSVGTDHYLVPNEESLKKLSEKLKEHSIAHKLWIEQPENIPTCVALKPYPKDEVKKFVGKYKLYKASLAVKETKE